MAGAVCAAVATTITAPAVAAGVVDTGTSNPVAASRVSGQTALTAAQQMLAEADKDLRDARATAQTVRIQAAAGDVAPEILAEINSIPGSPYSPGLTDIQMMAGLMDSGNPRAVLEETPIEDLSTLNDQGDPAAAPTTEAANRDPVSTADQRVKVVQERQVAAKRLVRQIQDSGTAQGPGAAKLARLCAEAGAVVDVCQPPTWSESHLKFDTVLIERYVNVHWDQVRKVGGWRPYDPYPDHPSGRAVDIMMPNSGKGGDVKLGNEIAKYFQEHAKQYGIYYMIWRQRIWKTGSPIGDWSGMSDRGSPTANHMDHVHISVTDGTGGTAIKELLKEARTAVEA